MNWSLALARPTPWLFWVGLPFVVAGEALRIWAVGYLTKLRTLVTAGPFGLCRNPIYLGSFLITVGCFVMCGRIDVWVAGTALFWLFHGGAIAYEEKLLRDRYGEVFADYCKTTPRLLPRLRGSGGSGVFSWKQVVGNDEHRSALGTFVLAAIFGLVAYFPNLAPAEWLSR